MVPEAYISHKTGQRLRIKIPSKKRDHEYFQSLYQHLASKPGVEWVDVNPLTGSVLIMHKADTEAFIKDAKKSALFTLKQSAPSQPTIHKAVKEQFAGFDKRIKDLTGGSHNIGAIAFLTLAGVGIYQIARGNFTAPAWYTAFWYAMNIFFKSDEKDVDAVAAEELAAAVEPSSAE